MSIKYLSENNEYDKVSRYQILRIVEEGRDQYLETYNQQKVPTSGSDSYHIVTHAEVNRLDIISEKFYGTPDYWWAIALANGFIDPFVVNEGIMVRIPSLITLNEVQNKILAR